MKDAFLSIILINYELHNWLITEKYIFLVNKIVDYTWSEIVLLLKIFNIDIFCQI